MQRSTWMHNCSTKSIMDDFSVRISREGIYECLDTYNFLMQNKKSFCEFGGLLIGHSDGKTYRIVKLFLDKEAETTEIQIKFSTKLHQRAQKWIKENSSKPDLFKILGTWHVHPPGSGTEYSDKDEKLLF